MIHSSQEDALLLECDKLAANMNRMRMSETPTRTPSKIMVTHMLRSRTCQSPAGTSYGNGRNSLRTEDRFHHSGGDWSDWSQSAGEIRIDKKIEKTQSKDHSRSGQANRPAAQRFQ